VTANMGTAAYMAPELSNAAQFARDFSRRDSELRTAKEDGDVGLVEMHEAAVQNFDLTMDSSSSQRQRLTSFPTPPQRPQRASLTKQTSATIKTKEVYKLDCYSFAIVLWVLLEWSTPFRDIPPMQILIAVGYKNKRPSTRNIVAAKWPEPVVDLMRRLWAANPAERPSIKEARDLLAQHS